MSRRVAVRLIDERCDDDDEVADDCSGAEGSDDSSRGPNPVRHIAMMTMTMIMNSWSGAEPQHIIVTARNNGELFALRAP